MCQKGSLWNKLFDETYKISDNLLNFGDKWCDKILVSMKNPFWKDVVKIGLFFAKNNRSPQMLTYLSPVCGTIPRYIKTICFSDWLKRHIFCLRYFLASWKNYRKG